MRKALLVIKKIEGYIDEKISNEENIFLSKKLAKDQNFQEQVRLQ